MLSFTRVSIGLGSSGSLVLYTNDVHVSSSVVFIAVLFGAGRGVVDGSINCCINGGFKSEG